MRKLYALLLAGFFGFAANAQLTGVKTIPGDYATIAAAVTAVNGSGVGAGGVTFNIAAGYVETITAPISLTATGTAANPIIFQKSGAGANPVITAYAGTGTPGSAVLDGIWQLVGSDYVTIDGISLNDPNAANPATMEFGFGLFKASVTDGAQNNTIKNCVVTLNRINNAAGSGPSVDGSTGILVINATPTAATTSLSPTTAGGTNSNNKFYTNSISNVNNGIALSGFAASSPFTAGDTGNDIGGSAAGTGNTILNYGGAPAAANPAAGIRANNQWSVNISYNTVNNNNGSGVNHVTTLRGIYAQAGTSANATINNNTVTVNSAATTSALTAIENGIGSTAASNTVNINNNTIQNCTYTTSTTGIFSGIVNSATPTTLNINGNSVINNSFGGTGTTPMIETGSPTTVNLNNNTISGNTRNGLSGSMYCLKTSSPTNLTASNNLVENNSFSTAASTGILAGFYGFSSSVNITVTSNTIRNQNVAGAGTLYGIREFGVTGNKTIQNNQIYNFTSAAGASMYGVTEATGVVDISGNVIYSFNSIGGTTPTITAINLTGGTSANIYKNKIYDLATSGTNPSLYGIYITGGGTNNIYNNMVGDLRATAANAAIPLAGIYLSGGTTDNAYYNTVNLNATSLGVLFGSAAIYASTTPTVELRNNIFVNTSTANGTGITAAYRRTSTTLTTYASASNNNLFYAGTPSATNVIYTDGTNTDQTIAAYKTRVSPRDASSFSEMPPFISTSGAAATFLHITAGALTQIESGGAPVTGITTDFDGDVRNATKPDVGADEFVGVSPAPVITLNSFFVTGTTIAGATPQCGIAKGRDISVSAVATLGTITSATITYNNGSGNVTTAMAGALGGSNGTFTFTIPAASPSNTIVTWSISVTNSSGITTIYPGTSYQDDPLSGVTGGAFASLSVVCPGNSTTLTAVLGSATPAVYTAPPAVTNPTTDEDLGNITISIPAGATILNNTSARNSLVGTIGTATGTAGSYSNFTGFGPYNLTAGQTYNFSASTVDAGGGFTNAVAIYIDYNRNGVFTDAGEQVYTSSTTTAGPHTETGSFTIPASAFNGLTRMRVIVNEGLISSSTQAVSWGEYEEYTLNISSTNAGGGSNTPTITGVSWSNGSTVVGTTNPLTVNPSANTTYTATITIAGGCTTTATTSVTMGASFSGTFNVGAGQPYTTLTAAVADYNTKCLSGPVTFLLTDPTYSAETLPIVINANQNASAANTLTIKPAPGVTAQITGSSAVTLLRLNGADFVTIDGSNNGSTSRNLILTNTNSGTSSSVIWVNSTLAGDGALNNTIKNVKIEGQGPLTTFGGIIVSGSAVGGVAEAPANNTVIQNNSVIRTQYGIAVVGPTALQTGVSVTNNTIGSPVAADYVGFIGMFVSNSTNSVFSKNTISNIITSATNPMGINVAANVTNSVFDGNIISSIAYTGTGGYGGKGININTGVAASNLRISNNMISGMSGDGWSSITGDAIVGIRILGTTGGVNVYHNSVNLSGTVSRSGATADKSAAFAIASTVTAINLRNNIFVNSIENTTGVATAYAIYSDATSGAFTAIDYNDYSVSGPEGVLGFLTTNQADLAAIQASFGSNANSLNVLPVFASATDLHLTPAASNAALDSKGTPISIVPLDIDGETRSTGAPDMGVDEFGSICFVPVIATQPVAATTVCEGSNVVLSVTASNVVTYQWQRNGVDVAGANAATLTLNSITAAQAGTYTVKLVGSGACNTPLISANAVVTVNTNPVITSQPSNQTACVGTTATFTVAATGTSLTYQWSKNGVPIAGATGATYTINPVTAGDAGTYTVVVTGICGTPVTSSSVTLGTNAAPTITTQPQSQGVCIGNNVTLTVVASGGGLTYQWFKNGNPIAGATNNTFTITGFTAGDAANYTVGITSPCATNTTSNVATLSVNTNAAIATQPQTQVACANTPATFSVTATGSSLTYQWRKAGTPIAGATNASYTINSVTASDVASYDVVVTGPCNSVTSSAASLIMTNPPVILTQPTNQAACANGSATFTVNATGTGLTYQWFNGNTAIPGANSNTYTVNPVTVASTYKVVVTGICGTPLTSNVVNLSINQPVVITAQPTAQSVCATSNTTFSVTATGTGLTYQWRKGGVAIAGATGATYTITNTPISAAGNYDVVVTGTCNAVTSNSVALTVNPAITLTSFVGSGSVCAGSTAAFSVTATSTGALTYQWRKNGVAITGATNSTYVINSATAADAGNYDVVISGLGTCTLTTGIIAMTVTTNCVTAVPNLNADVSSVILLPNIVRQNATLQVTVRRAMKIDWTVTDARGSVVLRFTQQAVAGSTNNIPVQATQLASGVYQITGVTANGKTSVVRFVKL